MKIAIMQPYFLPYIGYFQLIKSVDIFVIYDDVNFIKQGWVNRNKILVGGNDFVFTIPLKEASSFVTIRETHVNTNQFIKWRSKFLRTVEQSYKKAPYFSNIYPIISSILHKDISYSIADFAFESIKVFSNYLGLNTKFILSSEEYSETKNFDREKRLHHIIRHNKCSHYINPEGGIKIYDKHSFDLNGIKLDFIKSNFIIYEQFNNDFVPWLSILDVLMFNSVEKVNVMLDQFELI